MSSVKDEDILTSKRLRNKEIRRIEVGYAKKLLAFSTVMIAIGYYYYEYIHEDPIEYYDDDEEWNLAVALDKVALSWSDGRQVFHVSYLAVGRLWTT